MMLKEPVSDSVVRRLPRYYRYLSELERAGVERTSSQALATQLGSTASQIRQDLNCFGGFGHQGYGYHVGSRWSAHPLFLFCYCFASGAFPLTENTAIGSNKSESKMPSILALLQNASIDG